MKKEVAWVDKSQVEGLIKLLKEYLKKENGRVVYVGIAYELFMNALLNNISIKIDYHKSEAFSLFRLAVQACFLKDNLNNPSNLLSSFAKNIKNNYRKQSEYYRVVTQMSLVNDFNTNFTNFRLLGFSVCIYKKLPITLSRSRQQEFEKEGVAGDSDEVTFIVVSGKANSPEDCMQKSMKIINAVRGLWRIRTKESLNVLAMEDKYKNIAETKYYLGEFHTIHNKNGSIIKNGLWWDNSYYSREPTKHRNVKLLQQGFYRDKNKLIKLPYLEEMLRFLDLYSQALDVLDKENKFLKLWQLIEIVLDTDDSDKLISMLSFNFQSRTVEKVILKSLRIVRNRLVHGDYSPINIDLSCYYLNKYINNLFKFALQNNFQANSFKEIRTILMTTNEKESIEEKLILLEEEKTRLRKIKKYISDVE